MEKTDRDEFSATQDTSQEATTSEQAQSHSSEHEEEIAALQAKLQEKEAEAKANYDLFLRERAEMENFKRRLQRDQADSLRFANEPLLRALIPVVDNLERAIEHAQGGGNGQPLVTGVGLVLRSLLEVLEKQGVTRMTAKGETFDPNKHEAMAQVESATVAPNTVVDEYHPGYALHGRLLRPALVTVAKAPVEGEKKSPA